jgi:hypothetical protein
MVLRGGTLLMSSGSHGNPDAMHPFVVLNNKCTAGRQALVSLSTIRSGQFHDSTCILERGVHPFVVVRSFAHYQHARVLDSSHIQKCIKGWEFHVKEPMPSDVVDQLLDGALSSRFTPRYVKNYLNDL